MHAAARITLAALLSSTACTTHAARAPAVDRSPRAGGAAVSFMFDDGWQSDVTLAWPTLARHHFSGASYVVTAWMGAPGHLSWTELGALDASGWEIGSHTVDHAPLAPMPIGTLPPDCAVAPTTATQELLCSREFLRDAGFEPYGIAYPQGAYNADTVRLAAGSYFYARGFYDPTITDARVDAGAHVASANLVPPSRYDIRVIQARWCDTLEQLEARLCDAFYDAARCPAAAPPGDRWGVVVFHRIVASDAATPPGCTDASTRGTGACRCVDASEAFTWPNPDLDALAGWVETTLAPRDVRVARPIDVFGSSTAGAVAPRGVERNVGVDQLDLPGATIAPYVAGRTTVAGRSRRGIAPTAETGLFIAASARGRRYVRSRDMTVVPERTYIAEATVDVAQITSARSIGLYVDEYVAGDGGVGVGTWVSGRLIATTCVDGPGCARAGQSIRDLTGIYTPTSALVEHARLQVFVEDGIGTLNVDNVSLRAL